MVFRSEHGKETTTTTNPLIPRSQVIDQLYKIAGYYDKTSDPSFRKHWAKMFTFISKYLR